MKSKEKNRRILAIYMACLLFILQMPVTVYAGSSAAPAIPGNATFTLTAPYNNRVQTGRDNTFTAAITSPTTSFSAIVAWQVVGGGSGTMMIPAQSNVIVTTGAAITVTSILRIPSGETASRLTVRAVLQAGDQTRTLETVVDVSRGLNLFYQEGNVRRRIDNYFDFGVRRPGYSAVSPLYVEVANPHDIPTGQLNVRVTGPDAGSFILRGGTGASDTSRTIASIGSFSYRPDAFSVAPRTGLAERVAPYTAMVSLYGPGVWEVFEVRFRVGDHLGAGVYTFTVRSRPGGTVSMNNSRFDTVWTGHFRYGERISVEARPDRDFFFERWEYTHGETWHPFRENTTFVMPNRDITLWADFTHYRDRLGDDWRTAPFREEPPYATLPSVPQAPPLVTVTPPPEQPLPEPTPPGFLPTPDPVVITEPPVTALSVNINGRPLAIDGHSALMVQGVPMIPVAEVFRAMGYSVEWNNDTRTATLRRNHIVLTVTEGSSTFTINGRNRTMRAPAVVVGDRLMVSFVEILESVGAIAHRDFNNAININVTI